MVEATESSFTQEYPCEWSEKTPDRLSDEGWENDSSFHTQLESDVLVANERIDVLKKNSYEVVLAKVSEQDDLAYIYKKPKPTTQPS